MSVILQTNYELELIALLVGHASAVTCMQLIGSDSAASSSQGDGLLVTGSTDGTLRVWDLTQTQLRLCVRVVEDGAVWALSSHRHDGPGLRLVHRRAAHPRRRLRLRLIVVVLPVAVLDRLLWIIVFLFVLFVRVIVDPGVGG
ncbi:hypothetical protein Pelo_19816 [Pelomyxa schiedti]|nr:hypothetical protein Pelo_19816 [Pelomyxa schiedti]